jgi:hypothetical protein
MAEAAVISLIAGSTVFDIGTQIAAADLGKAQAKNNEKLAKTQAELILKRGEEHAARIRQMGVRIQGAQRATLAGQNVVVGEGVALELENVTRRMIETDVLTARNNAALQAVGIQTEARQTRIGARLAERSAELGIVGSVLEGAADITGVAMDIG